MPDCALIVFVKNTSAVKTRIAAVAGSEKASMIYEELLNHTSKLCDSLDDIDVIVFYSSDFQSSDIWKGNAQSKHLQAVGDLGTKMNDSFLKILNTYSKAVVIGSDCPYITKKDIELAFDSLSIADVVIGPADDGGYYLIGMKRPMPYLFSNIEWSTSDVFSKTIDAIFLNNNSVQILRRYSDIDLYQDYINWIMYKDSLEVI
jgi:uncharacterized protein